MIIAAAILVLAGQAPPARSLPDCVRLAASLDAQDGAFDGMSHSGVLLTLRNTGPIACTVPGLPSLSFLTRSGRRLDIARRAPAGMHPGPVVRPLVLAPGASAGAPLRWVSGNVFDNGRCLSPVRMVVQAGAWRRGLAFRGTLCGALGEPVPFDQSVLSAHPDPG